MSVSGMTKRPAPQNMKFRLAGGDAACSAGGAKGILYGQNESARVPKAARKIKAENLKGAQSSRRCTPFRRQIEDMAPISGKTRRYGRSNQRVIRSKCMARARTKAVARKASTT